ncbi:YHS domain-containing (seleno)protein [Parasulfitobacter algicola]|uniref:YHS domain protein n=1 Tax=Parasulfitobacter algicola TaxID=2614809 RepID=A0ABX2IQ72_9RHOB|nr:YHS domain-containing (seleno)protein [Sulfitobacter algicola]NSX55034.1 YHS domain protein [Sulfitobacter algicola]
MPITRRNVLLFAAAVPTLTTIATIAHSATPTFYAEDGIAVDGTDVVAYFTQGQPVAGSPDLTYDWMGATWRFSTEENRTAFIDNPDSYAPQYGGYCAYAVSEGYTASTVPDAWTIVDDKLYLNFSLRVQRRWSRDIPGRIAKADANWPSVLN